MSLEAMKQALVEDLDRYADMVENEELISPDELNCAAIMRLAAQAIAEAEKQEPVAWATREDFYRELERSVERARKEMEVKSVTMRCKDYDLALPIIGTHFGRVLVGQVSTPPQRQWVGLTDEERSKIWGELPQTSSEERDACVFAEAVEIYLKERNT